MATQFLFHHFLNMTVRVFGLYLDLTQWMKLLDDHFGSSRIVVLDSGSD